MTGPDAARGDAQGAYARADEPNSARGEPDGAPKSATMAEHGWG